MISQQELNEWLMRQGEKVEAFYKAHPEREPKNYANNREAMAAIIKSRDKQKLIALQENRKKLTVGDAAEIIIRTVAVVAVPVQEGYSIAIYDYDKKLYTFSQTTVLNDYLVAILGASSQSILNSLVMTMTGMRAEMTYYNPLPKYMIAVGNGIYNCLTKRLQPFTPRYTVLTRIETNFRFNAAPPVYPDGFTLEQMIDSLSNGSAARRALIGQICKSIITGHSLKPGLFVILGPGGGGKSTFFTFIANLIGDENVAYVNFSEFESPDKMLETMNKKLVLGMDNDVKIYIKKTALLKTMASHEMITLSRKYATAISVPFTATVVQLCNEFPRIAETGSSIKRRVVPFKAERSHYENKSENVNVDNVYIKDRAFLEYALWYFMNEATNPYYSDFNDTDRKIVNDVLDAEDVLGQFIEEMHSTGVLSEINQEIPKNHLYACYQDWMDIHADNMQKLTPRAFGIRITDHMYDAGYTVKDSMMRVRPRSIEQIGKYSVEAWGPYKHKTALKRVIDENEASALYIRDHEPKRMAEIRRNSRVISAIEYFQVDVAIRSYLAPKADDVDPYDIDAMNALAERYEAEQRGKVIDITSHVQETVIEETGVPEDPPLDIRVAMKERDRESVDTFIAWLNDVDAAYRAGDLDDVRYLSIAERAMEWVNQVAYTMNDAEMIGILMELDDLFETNELTRRAIESYVSTYFGGDA